jgi:steroid 5-alpha reductase family enzyme
MVELNAYALAFAVVLAGAVLTWIVSVFKRDASIVDSLWALMFLAIASVYATNAATTGPRLGLILALTAVWAVRLAGYITWRNWGEAEDRRYVAIRQRNEPGYAGKSLYLVFGLQAVLAALIATPLAGAISGGQRLGVLDALGVLLWLTGFLFESIGDWQLARFKANPANRGRVLDTGLWHYTRHPNYFGESLIWWGFYLVALSAGAWWTIFAPLLMTFLLLKVSGVVLLEQDIAERRPAYRDYIARTNAFIPGPPKRRASSAERAS